MKTFNSLTEMQPYYNEDTNTYTFAENGICFDVCFAFDLSIDSNITAQNINAWNIHALKINAQYIEALDIKALNINAQDIDALDINAQNINARNISFYAICYAYQTFFCKSITGRRGNAKYFCLDSEVKIEEVKK